MLGGTLSYASQVAKGAVAVWFVSWALRRKYELDQRLDWRAQTVRWMLISIAYGLTLLGGSNLAVVRITAWILGTTFLAWPNLAYYILAMFDQSRSPKSSGQP